MPARQQTVTIDGHRLRLSNLDKVLYPATGTTKADVIAYYSEIAPVMIPHTAGRPATRKRWPNGVGTEDDPGEMFFQKNLGQGVPDWVTRGSVEHSDHTNDYPMVNDRATLAWLGQVAALEIHVPQWRLGSDGERRNPDRLVLDLDPGSGAGLPECVEVARLARVILQGMGLEPVPVTSGSKGIHLYADLDGSHTSDQISDLAHELARALESDHPDLVVSDMKKTLRHGKVLVDWSQNNANKTTIAPYSMRGRSHPTVAVPRTWRELGAKNLRHLDYTEALERVRRRGDPMAELGRVPGGDAGAVRDRLEVYRAKRDAAKTPEPVPAELPPPTEEHTFVIQEHHARRLHYDLRLAHEGVLASWALPKGVPVSKEKNHLAVQTEDHPMEYATFSGTIPAGEYGAGEMTIWDTGTYELEKWREGKEVIVTLTGGADGGLAGQDGPGRTSRFALIRTGGRGGREDNQWLIHLMDPPDGARSDAAAGGSGKASSAATDDTAAPGRSSRGRGSSAPPRRAPGTATKGGGGGDRGRLEVPSPMLATLGEVNDLSDTHEWALEMKWDGIRAIVAVEDGQVRLVSRNGNDMSRTYPELAGVADCVDAGTAILDAEIIATDERGRPSFAVLQQRMNLTKPRDVERARAEVPVHLMVFDLLEVDGASWLSRSYDERREALSIVVDPERDRHVDVPPAYDGDIDAAVADSRAWRLEGVMAKRRNSRYTPGRRSRMWIKIKHAESLEVVVVGWMAGQGSRSGQVGSLLLAVPDGDGDLVYVGKVGTGFTAKEAAAWLGRLRRIERKTPPVDDVPRVDAKGARWVTPSLVAEVEFAEITPTGRLRHPRWRGWRPDKDVEDVQVL